MMSGNKDYIKVLNDVLLQAKRRDYSGYEKFDALNSPFLKFMSFNIAWLRFIYIQAVKEFPINIRPLFGVKKVRNQKGMALFARSYLFLYQITGQKEQLKEAVELIDWLIEHPSPGQKNLCWGYSFHWQDIPPFYQKKDDPNIVVTCFVGEALVHAYKITNNPKYLEALISVARFITEDIPVMYEDEKMRAISYILSPVDYIVLNVQVMSASLLAKIYKHTNDNDLLHKAAKQVAYLVDKKTDYYAWYYTFPQGKSYIRHDNYHTGGILDNLLEYIEESGDTDLMDIYRKGLDYYEKNLFGQDGAPRWMNDKKYPHDIHGAAQGIISFAKASAYDIRYMDIAQKIAGWTLDNMYRPSAHDFIYRKSKFFRWNFSLIRWCNGWMSRALGELAYRNDVILQMQKKK
jgi:hypothetical protein